WQLEVTFREVRAHLGVETQRQWSDRAIARTTPVLLGLFSLVTLLAHHLLATGSTLPAVMPPGTTNRSPPLPTPWPSSGVICGFTPLSPHPLRMPIWSKSPAPSSITYATCSAMRPEWTKSS